MGRSLRRQLSTRDPSLGLCGIRALWMASHLNDALPAQQRCQLLMDVISRYSRHGVGPHRCAKALPGPKRYVHKVATSSRKSFFNRNAHGAAMSGLNHNLNCVRLRSSLRHACMAFSHARLVSDLSSGEGGNEACNAARRSGSALSKYAQKEPDSQMSCQAWYSLVRQIASTPAARCITRRSQSVAGVIGSSHTCAAAAR